MQPRANLDTRSVEELRQGATEIVRRVAQTRRPVAIQAEGQPPVVLLDLETYEHQLHLINLARLLLEGMEDVRAGRTRPLEEFLREFADAEEIPGRNLRSGSA